MHRRTIFSGTTLKVRALKLVNVILLFFITATVAYGGNEDKRISAEEQAAMERLEREISVSIAKHNSLPRKQQDFGATGDRVIDLYLKSFFLKLERVGSLNYPQEAKGKIYGKVTASFEIHSNGAVRNIVIVKSSGHEILDRAIINIITLSSPAVPFPPELRARADILEIKQAFYFTSWSARNGGDTTSE